ncbi:MAG: diaminopimelate epimerase, partial [Candidatus Eremiobacteraeota bacterium]|nr:diaminopimelate epimerase [Candidatus Eremiobacteraeota bacterium]
ELCDRGAGDGADGLLVIEPPPDDRSLVTMRVLNADGSEAEMCGNGVRCVARFLAERGAPDRFRIATAAGPIDVEILSRAAAYSVLATMGTPRLEEESALEIDGRTWRYRAVSLGNPHAVIFVRNVSAIDLERDGKLLATHPRFPNGTNVHFVEIVDSSTIRARHYERGVGITQSCGTGAVASVVAAVAAGKAKSPVTVHVPGGTLVVEWRPDGTATMTGPAEHGAASSPHA